MVPQELEEGSKVQVVTGCCLYLLGKQDKLALFYEHRFPVLATKSHDPLNVLFCEHLGVRHTVVHGIRG